MKHENQYRNKNEYIGTPEEADLEPYLQELQEIDEYMYLDSITSKKETTDKDLRNRKKDKKCMRMLNSLLWSDENTS